MYRKNDDILKNGYGIVYKAVMTDERLSLTSKAIYAYLCSYSGSKGIVFPSRNRILSELNISKNAYYKHFNQLVELNYIVIKKRKNFLNRNQYVINDNPSTVRTENSQQEEALKTNGIKAFGYGIIPKSVMTNPNLSAKAKGLMAYFYSLAGNGIGTFPTKKVILKQLAISNTAYYNALHQLVENNYLTINQRKSEGKFEQNEYIITNFTSPQNQDTKKEKKHTPNTQKCDIQKCDNNNNNKVYNKNNISLNNYHISSRAYLKTKSCTKV